MIVDYVEGIISVKAVIEAKRREVYQILISQKKYSRNLRYVIRLAKAENIEVKFVNKAKLEKYTDNKNHGGILALISKRKYADFNDLLIKDKPFLAILEGIEDPFNFGYCLRSLYAAGCDGVIVTERDWSNASSTVIKSSAGASEFITMYKSDDLVETIKALKAHDLKLYAAYRKDSKSIYETEFSDSLILAIGGEKRGLSKPIIDLADYYIHIPYANDFRNAINGSSATAIISFEIFRNRGI